MTQQPPGRPCSSPARPEPAGRPAVGWSSGRPLPPGTTTTQESLDTPPTNTRSSQPNGTNWRPGSVWLITERTWPAWQATWDLIRDGQWHPATEVAELMHQAADLAPRTIHAHLRSASARGWIRQRRGEVKIRDSHALDAALSWYPDLMEAGPTGSPHG